MSVRKFISQLSKRASEYRKNLDDLFTNENNFGAGQDPFPSFDHKELLNVLGQNKETFGAQLIPIAVQPDYKNIV